MPDVSCHEMTLPSLVLLPGLDGTGLLFGPLLAALPSEVAPIVVSYPGDSPLAYSELLPLVLAALPTDRPFVLLGESFSGPLAVMAAAARPAGLVGVVLCASFIRNPHSYVPSFLATAVRSPVLRLFPRFSQVKALLGGYSIAIATFAHPRGAFACGPSRSGRPHSRGAKGQRRAAASCLYRARPLPSRTQRLRRPGLEHRGHPEGLSRSAGRLGSRAAHGPPGLS